MDLCNKLGNIQTCGVRDIKFSIDQRVIIPVEFSINRVILVSKDPEEIKLMSKCPSGVEEFKLKLDAVIQIPDNCSYVNRKFTIDSRESNINITREIGIVSFNKLEIDTVGDISSKIGKLSMEKLDNFTRGANFEANRKEIDDRLNLIDIRHSSFGATYFLEKWVFSSVFGGIIILVVVVRGTICIKKFRRKKLNKIDNNLELAELKLKLKQANDRLSKMVERLNNDSKKTDKVTDKKQDTQAKSDDKIASTIQLGSRQEHVYIEIADKNFSSLNDNAQF